VRQRKVLLALSPFPLVRVQLVQVALCAFLLVQLRVVLVVQWLSVLVRVLIKLAALWRYPVAKARRHRVARLLSRPLTGVKLVSAAWCTSVPAQRLLALLAK
jgi:hypothetical protein